LTFNPNSQELEINKKLVVRVSPIDASKINPFLNSILYNDGNYEQESILVDTHYSQDKDFDSELDRTNIEKLNLYFNIIDSLASNGLISQYIKKQFKTSIYNYIVFNDDIGFNGLYSDSGYSKTFEDNLNPFYVSKTYLSLFKLEFENKSEEIQTVKISDFLIKSGDEQLNPFSTNTYHDYFKIEGSKLLSISRLNMPDVLKLMPNQKVVKYFGVPPLNFDDSTLTVSYISDLSPKYFNFKQKQSNISKEKIFKPIFVYLPKNSNYKPYIIANLNDHKIFPLKGETLYIESGSSPKLTLYGIQKDNFGVVKFIKKEYNSEDLKGDLITFDFRI